MPSYAGSAGILSDQERVALRKLGVPLTGGAMEGVAAEFAEIYGVFCGAGDCVHISCAGGIAYRTQISGASAFRRVDRQHGAGAARFAVDQVHLVGILTSL